MWDERKQRIHDYAAKRLAGRKEWYDHDFSDELDGLGDDLVDASAYQDAASAGFDAVPNDTNAAQARAIGDVWIGHVRKYANQVAGRIADALAATANETQPEESPDDVLARIDAKLEGLRNSITRYAEPVWGAGQNGYGAALEASSVLIDWVLGDAEHCDDCLELAARSPYARGQVPTWPGMGDTRCFDNCKCTIEAEEESWNAAFPAAA